MKLTMYLDVYPGWKPENAFATANPSWQKSETGKRLSFEIDIPDWLITPEVDVRLQGTSVAKEIK